MNSPDILTFTEAIRRLSDDDPIESRFEARPNSGLTRMMRAPRAAAIRLLAVINNVASIYESGWTAQQLDFGIYCPFVHRDHGDGLLFFKTKPETRVPEAIILSRQINVYHCCPCCLTGRLLGGPRGGACINAACTNPECLKAFNLAFHEGAVFHVERITRNESVNYTEVLWP